MQNLSNVASEQSQRIWHESDRVRTLGGKASGLVRACLAGFDVPDFVAIPVGEIALMSPDNLGPQVEHFLTARRHRSAGESFAVRSSMAIEDQPGESAAGLGHTELNVIGRWNLFVAFQRVAASFHADAVQSYVCQMGGPACRMEGTVVLQDMVTPTLSGVLFTCDPFTGDPSRIHIDAVCGPCKRVVDGFATIQAVVDRLTNVTTAKGPSAKALTPEHVMKLTDLIDRHDARIGLRYDIEFAFLDGLTPIVLQSRPVTTPSRQHS